MAGKGAEARGDEAEAGQRCVVKCAGVLAALGEVGQCVGVLAAFGEMGHEAAGTVLSSLGRSGSNLRSLLERGVGAVVRRGRQRSLAIFE